MTRKDMFEGIVPQVGQGPTSRPIPGAFMSGPVAAIGVELRNASGRAVMDIEIEQIDLGNQADRMGITDEDVRDLRDAIIKNGQQVPILVRPSSDGANRYEVVYGRRRVHAMRGLGKPIRALVRSMSDEEVLVAQAQENALRRDPSFIEKAMFARSMMALGYNQTIVADSLSVDRTIISRMSVILDSIPDDLIRAIGPAHGMGRRVWGELADRLKASKIPPSDLITDDLQDIESDKRLEQVIRKLDTSHGHRNRGYLRTVVSDAGAIVGQIKSTDREVSILIDRRKNAEFGEWLNTNGQSALLGLYKQFTAKNGD